MLFELPYQTGPEQESAISCTHFMERASHNDESHVCEGLLVCESRAYEIIFNIEHPYYMHLVNCDANLAYWSYTHTHIYIYIYIYKLQGNGVLLSITITRKLEFKWRELELSWIATTKKFKELMTVHWDES